MMAYVAVVTCCSSFDMVKVVSHYGIKPVHIFDLIEKFAFDGLRSVDLCPLRAKFQSARECTITVRHNSTLLHLTRSFSRSAISCLSIISPVLILTDISYHAVMQLRHSVFFSYDVR